MSEEHIGSSETGVATVRTEAATASARPDTEPSPDVLECLMAVAERYHAENAIRQAMEMYFEMVENYEGTPQAKQARKRLMEIAAHYEHAGQPHHARGIYERLV